MAENNFHPQRTVDELIFEEQLKLQSDAQNRAFQDNEVATHAELVKKHGATEAGRRIDDSIENIIKEN